MDAAAYPDPDKTERYVDVSGTANSDGTVHIAVRDNGIGIPEAALPRIFERFTETHAEHVELPHVGGIGLGLAIIDDCVRAVGGRIEVQAAETAGATFVMTLPNTPSSASR